MLAHLPRQAPGMSVPTGSPVAAQRDVVWAFRSKTRIGRSFSMHRDTAVAVEHLELVAHRSA